MYWVLLLRVFFFVFLNGLCNKHLSFGEIVCLLKLVLSSILLYFLCFFLNSHASTQYHCELAKKFSLGVGGAEGRKLAWVKWETICLPKKQVGRII